MYSNSVQLLQSSLMTHVESTQHVSEHLKPNCFHWATSFMQSMRSVYGTVSFTKYVYCSQKKNPCAMHLRAVGQAGGHGEGASTSQSFHRIQSAHGLWSQIKSSPVQGLLQKLNRRRFNAMCSPAGERRVWSPRWIHCLCWTAPSGFPPRCSARLWGVGRCSRRPGWSCPCRRTRRGATGHSLARCSEPRTASSSDGVWNRRFPEPSICESVWQQVKEQ